jgi:hypothetical protein
MKSNASEPTPDVLRNGPPAEKSDFEFGANDRSAPDSAPDPFDVARLRLSADEDINLGVKELLVSLPFRKPSKETFFRVHPTLRTVGGLIELKDDDTESYWVDPSLWSALTEEPTFGRRQVFTCCTRAGAVFLWGCRLPGPDGKQPDWVTIPLEAAKAAETKWVKMFWDQSQRRHRIKVSQFLEDEPAWPDLPLGELLRLAFKDKVIATTDHPILRRLRGEV